jgi:hypothetical protein
VRLGCVMQSVGNAFTFGKQELRDVAKRVRHSVFDRFNDVSEEKRKPMRNGKPGNYARNLTAHCSAAVSDVRLGTARKRSQGSGQYSSESRLPSLKAATKRMTSKQPFEAEVHIRQGNASTHQTYRRHAPIRPHAAAHRPAVWMAL